MAAHDAAESVPAFAWNERPTSLEYAPRSLSQGVLVLFPAAVVLPRPTYAARARFESMSTNPASKQ